MDQTAPMSMCRRVCTCLGAILFCAFCGTTFIIGTTAPYIADYFRVGNEKVQLLFPSIVLFQTCIMPIGGYVA